MSTFTDVPMAHNTPMGWDGTVESTRNCRFVCHGGGISVAMDTPFPNASRNSDSEAAYATAAWPQRADLNGSLSQFLNPPLEADERQLAAIEGWILGVV